MKKTSNDIFNQMKINSNKPDKTSLNTSKSTNKSSFSFKNSTTSNRNQSLINNQQKQINIDKKILKQIFEILKLRLFIESILEIKDETVKDIINENAKLINFKDYDIQSINKFVDDLVDIIKSENKKDKNISLLNKNKSEIENEENNLKFFRRKTIQTNTIGYRPASVVTQRRRTIEFFLERPKPPEKSLKFNMFEKSLKKQYSFYEGDPYNPENNVNYDSDKLNDYKNKLIDDIQNKN